MDGFIKVHIGALNGVPAQDYKFKIVKLLDSNAHNTKASYSSLMIKACAKYGLLPVCDHPNYCRTDSRALYIGQAGHLSHGGHRNDKKFHAGAGWEKIKDKWIGLCSYTSEHLNGGATADKNYGKLALCNVPVSNHNWQSPDSSGNPGFMCGREDSRVSSASVFYIQITWAGGNGCSHGTAASRKNGHNTDPESMPGVMCLQVDPKGKDHMRTHKCDKTVNAQMFRMEELSGAMFKGKLNAPNQVGVYRLHSKLDDSKCLQPVSKSVGAAYVLRTCNARASPSDSQAFHLSHFMDDEDDHDVFNWATADGRAIDAAHCLGFKDNTIVNSYRESMNQAKRWQMLVSDVPLRVFRAHLGALNGVAAAEYEFRITSLSASKGSSEYGDRMIKACKRFGMRPVCGHPVYCKNDAKSLYLGQVNHLSYPPHRHQAEQNPVGFTSIMNMWEGLCVYTAKSEKQHRSLCNIPVNTHTWRTPAQANPGFVCGQIGELTTG